MTESETHKWQDWLSRPSARLPDKTFTDVIYLVHTHWFSFAPLNPMWFYGAATFAITLVLFGFVNIGFALHKFATATIATNQSSVFLFLHCLNELGLLVLKIIPHIYFAIFGASNGRGWSWGPLFCQISAGSGSLFFCADVLISVSFLWFTYRVPNPSSLVVLICTIAAYGMSAVVACVPLTEFGSFSLEGMLTTCSFDYLTHDLVHRSHVVFWLVLHLLMPLFIAIFALCSPAALESETEKNLKLARKAALVAFLLRSFTSLPYIATVLLSQVYNQDIISPILVTFTSLVANGSTFCYIPIHYIISKS